MIRCLMLGAIVLGLQACGGGGGGGATTPPPPPVNSAPVASGKSVATNPDTILNDVLSASDANGDALTYSVVGAPASGSVSLSGAGDRDFSYSPNAGFVGADSFTFNASDGQATSGTATVTIQVNSKPVANGTSVSTSEIASVAGSVSATDAEGDAVTFAITTQPSKGTLAAFDAATGAFTYAPDSAQDGADTFGITASDGFQASDEAIVSVEVFKWGGTQQFGTSADDSSTTGGLVPSSDGGFIFGGYTKGSFAGHALNGAGDAWLRKVDRRGNDLWTVQFGGVAEDNSRMILPDPDGSGTFVIATEFVPEGAVLYKFDNHGNEQLSAAVDFLGEPTRTSGYRGNVDSNGDLYVLSWHSGSDGTLITKVDGTNGNTLWQDVMHGTSDPVTYTPSNPGWDVIHFRNVTFHQNGNIVVFGRILLFAPLPGVACSHCAFYVTYDSDGNRLSTVLMDDFAAACSQGSEAAMYRATYAPDGTLWAVGYGGYGSGNSFGQVVRYNADASQILWSYCDVTGAQNSQYYTPVLFLADGNGLLVGEVEADAAADSSEVVVTKLDASTGGEIFRTMISATRADSTPADFLAGSVVEDSQGLIYVTGATDGELVPGAGSGGLDAFILRLDADGDIR